MIFLLGGYMDQETFDMLEAEHDKLMGLVEEQGIIMDRILDANMIVFLWDMFFGHQFRNAKILGNHYLAESQNILDAMKKAIN
jgi:hypothetical protein